MATKTFTPQPTLSIFRATKTKNGYASRFQLSRKADGKTSLFLEVAEQIDQDDANGNANYAWRGGKNSEKGVSVTLKLGNADIGELLAVLRGVKNIAGTETGKYQGIFHSNATGNSTLNFKVYEKDGKVTSYLLDATNKKNDKVTKCNHTVSFGEAELLRVFLERSLVEMNKWYLEEVTVPVSKEKTQAAPVATSADSNEAEFSDPYDTLPGEDIPF